jgi:hypothetical protein
MARNDLGGPNTSFGAAPDTRKKRFHILKTIFARYRGINDLG